MNWDREAEKLLGRVPFFVRPLARGKIEEFARAQGRPLVTACIAQQAYDSFRGVSPERPQADDDMPPAALIDRLEAEAEQLAKDDRLRTRHYQVRPCAGAVGCPRSLIPAREVAEGLVDRIVASGFPLFLEQGLAGRSILSHHRFHVAVAGCPNACSQQQIRDFGVIGVAAIEVGADLCDGCLRCAKACREAAIAVQDRTPIIADAACIKCADCVRACPTGALRSGACAYRVLAGGRLGRRPRLADEVAAPRASAEVAELLDRALRLLMDNGRPGERLAALMERGVALD